MNQKHFISHVSSDGRQEEVSVHLKEVAEMAAGFAKVFGGEELAYLSGMSHDIGKYSDAFQDRILRNGPKVDHSTAGAYELFKRGLPYSLFSYCVAGHHGGLPDGGSLVVDTFDDATLAGRMKKAKEGRIAQYEEHSAEEILDEQARYLPLSSECTDDGFACSFLIRMIYSCLVDADYLCTERFMLESNRMDCYASIESLVKRIEEKTDSFYPPRGAINNLRCGLLDDCLNAASEESGFFTLTAPTGSGKTIASLSFALHHAQLHGFERVIYAIPYTTIIEQNAAVFREILGEQNVVEAHSNIFFDEDEERDENCSRLRLAVENWDAPVVVTTNVQFFESFYSNKPSKNRKLHNIANSVIVLDEAQTLPIENLLPCVRVLCELVLRYRCSVVFCTATQPMLSEYLDRCCCTAKEIVSDHVSLAEQMKRVEYRFIGKVSDSDLSGLLRERNQVLCVVNSRKQARALFELVGGAEGGEGVYHLSTLMHPVHREEILSIVRNRLENNLPCLLVATSLVEAGVDIDFPVVFRAVAGADSVVQAAGRCNRNGKNAAKGVVYVFDADGDESSYPLPKEIENRAQITKTMMRGRIQNDISKEENNRMLSCYLESLEFVEDFFSRLYEIGSDRMDEHGALEEMRARKGSNVFVSYPFKSVSERFSLISNRTSTIVVPSKNVADVLHRLEFGTIIRGDFGKLLRYSVGVFPGDLERMNEQGAVKLVAPGLYVLLNEDLYDEHIGLKFDATGGQAVMF